MLYLAAALALLIGALLGLLGGGGSILTVPMLVYLLGVPASSAIPTSLVVVGATSFAAMIPAARAGNVRFRAGALIAAGAVVGAFGGGKIAHFLPGTVLLAAFGALMLGAAFAMMRRRAADNTSEARPLGAPFALAVGLAIGIVSGLVGAGGGFLIVPALVLVAGVSIRDAVGTSLFVIALQSAAGFAGQIAHAKLDTKLALIVTVASIIGAQVGVRLGRRLSAAALRSGFAWLVLILGTLILGREAHPIAGAIGAVLVIAISIVSRRRAARLVASSEGSTTVSTNLPQTASSKA
ncbi:MAG: sulfite exporter TauE/SafE family protein [Polyangiaceae bacterium]|nr:sulfite exporter TauE/SafE family protein [Polyangiaceae bacterium]